MAGVKNPTVLVHSAPTQFVDGSPIPAGTITKYQYAFGSTPGQYTMVKDDVDLTSDASGKQTYAVPALAFGDWYAAARAVTKDGAMGAWSNEVTFTLAAKDPKPIVDFSAQ